MMDLVGLAAVPRAALPARVLGRPAPAHRHRPGARPRARPRRLRRAGVGARRVDPGAGPQPAQAAPARARPDLRLRRPQHGRRRAHQRPGRGHVPRPDRRAGRPRASCSAKQEHPYTAGAHVGDPDPGPGRSAASGSSSRATCRARSTRRRAAGSTRAARSASSSAPGDLRGGRAAAHRARRRATCAPATSAARDADGLDRRGRHDRAAADTAARSSGRSDPDASGRPAQMACSGWSVGVSSAAGRWPRSPTVSAGMSSTPGASRLVRVAGCGHGVVGRGRAAGAAERRERRPAACRGGPSVSSMWAMPTSVLSASSA